MYNIAKLIVMALLAFSINAFALNDSEELEFVGAVGSGDMKTVKKFVETMNVRAWKIVILLGHLFL